MQEIISKMLDLKLSEIKNEIKNISHQDLYNYIVEVILKNNKIRDVNDAAFYIMNIKVNKLYEYLNFKNIKDDSNTIEMDLKSILEG
ncbi:hypothetical protein SCULI_v1c04720 [Spiroplasma culicicola AES-1]|uniref:Uncharacterized protein n=2 Tax=Spiroplasma culicicola TaxID=216935 RepID=W6A6S6_9MOLU|nr:hypothetical protein SCULI_v1c04720 [Spiroplasma culicicola AES-1]